MYYCIIYMYVFDQLCIAVYVVLSYVIITLYIHDCVMDGKIVLFMRFVQAY